MKILNGIKILDLTKLLPGPLATQQLQKMGAVIYRVEHPDKLDLTQLLPPIVRGKSAYYQLLNSDKHIIEIAYDTLAGLDKLKTLIKSMDVLVENFRPGVMDFYGLSTEMLKSLNPNLIYVAASSYGRDGAYAQKPGHDLNFIAHAGLLQEQAEVAGYEIPNIQFADIYGGTEQIINSVLLGLIQRYRKDIGGNFDVSIVESCLPLTLLKNINDWHESTSFFTFQLPNYAVYQCKDGGYIAFAGLEMKFWNKFCQLMEKEKWIGLDIPQLYLNKFIYEELKNTFRTEDLTYWLTLLEEENICVSAVLKPEDLLKDPYFKSRNSFVLDSETGLPKSWKLGIRTF
ncbi:MAG: CoA transferase [Flavobacterium sp.]|nr:CoA transferase [Candidatus Neoflavobacterium equi]